jgi:5-methylthioadenosine/S-adenosylhomocysteine deaminase
MIKMGVRVGLGLDGAASNPSQDMFQEMRLASILHKGFLHDPKVVSSEKSLRMATTEAANILGLEDKLGRISDGYWADIVLINISRTGYLPYEALTHHLVHSAQPSDVVGVTVGGELLIWNGVHMGLDEVSLLNEAKSMFSEFLQGIGS